MARSLRSLKELDLAEEKERKENKERERREVEERAPYQKLGATKSPALAGPGQPALNPLFDLF